MAADLENEMADARTEKELTPKQAQFVREYLVDMNGTQAAIRCGYSERTANEQAARLLAVVSVREAVQKAMDKRAERTEITADRVLREIAAQAFYDAADIGDIEVTCPKDIRKLPENVRRCIIGWSWDKAGNFVLKFSPKTPSLDLLGRHLKLFTDKVELSGAVDQLTDAQIEAKIAALATSMKGRDGGA